MLRNTIGVSNGSFRTPDRTSGEILLASRWQCSSCDLLVLLGSFIDLVIRILRRHSAKWRPSKLVHGYFRSLLVSNM